MRARTPLITRRHVHAAAMAGMLALLAACGGEEAPPQGEMPKPEVAVGTAAAENVPLALTYTARTVGSREVEVRARVGGILLERRYVEGTAVRAGDVLFEIDPEPYRAAAAQARAEVAVERATLEETRRNRDRLVPLFEKNAVSQRQRDEAVSAFEVAEARVASAEARLRTAELELGYTQVRAPIAGLTSRELRSEGSLVQAGADSSLLTRMVQVDPLYVEFSVPEEEASLLREHLARAEARKALAAVVLASDGEYPERAAVTFVDNAVETASGTVLVRAVLPNRTMALVPGQFVRVRVEGMQLADVIAIPRKAVMASPQGSFVWVVGENDTASFRPVQMGRGIEERVVITQGLAPGERYVVEGVMKVQPGVQVSAVPAAPATRDANVPQTPAAGDSA